MVSLNVLSALMARRAIGVAETKVPAGGLKSWGKAWVLVVLSVSSHRAVRGGHRVPEFLTSPYSVHSVPDNLLFLDL